MSEEEGSQRLRKEGMLEWIYGDFLIEALRDE